MQEKKLIIQEIQGVFFDREQASQLVDRWLTQYFGLGVLDLPDTDYWDEFIDAIQNCETTADLSEVKRHLITALENGDLEDLVYG